MSLLPDCHVTNGAGAVDCKVKDRATVKFWFTCGQFAGTREECKEVQTWLETHADFSLRSTHDGPVAVVKSTHDWSGKTRTCWEAKLTTGFLVPRKAETPLGTVS